MIENDHDNLQARRFPSKLAFHLLREFLLPFFCTVLAFSAMFLLRDVIDDITDFGGTGIPSRWVVAYFGVKLLLNLVNIVPISILLSTSFMMVMLGRNSELTAIRSAGLSLARCGTWIWVVAALCGIAVFCIGESSAPLCSQVLDRVRTNWLDKSARQSSARRVEYTNMTEGRDWFFADFHTEGASRGVKVSIYEEIDGVRRVARTISAETAECMGDGVWVFRKADISVMGGESGRTAPKVAHEQEVREHFSETPEKILSHSKRPEEMNILELLAVIRDGHDLGSKTIKEARIRLWYRITFPLACLVGALFGFALSIPAGRAGVLKGFASSVGLLVLFYLVGEFLRVWGMNGSLPPIVAGAFSNVAFFVAGILAVRKNR